MARPLSARCIRTLVEKAADSAELNEDSNHSDHRINKKATNQTESISARLGFTTLSEVSGLAFEVSPRQKEKTLKNAGLWKAVRKFRVSRPFRAAPSKSFNLNPNLAEETTLTLEDVRFVLAQRDRVEHDVRIVAVGCDFGAQRCARYDAGVVADDRTSGGLLGHIASLRDPGLLLELFVVAQFDVRHTTAVSGDHELVNVRSAILEPDALEHLLAAAG